MSDTPKRYRAKVAKDAAPPVTPADVYSCDRWYAAAITATLVSIRGAETRVFPHAIGAKSFHEATGKAVAIMSRVRNLVGVEPDGAKWAAATWEYHVNPAVNAVVCHPEAVVLRGEEKAKNGKGGQ